VLDYVELGEARYRKVETYSTGMKQRLKIASAIVHDPRMVILDEPTNGMDPAGRLEVLELTRDLARNKGISLLFSSHLMPDVESVCDHILVMGRGRLLAQGSVADLTRAERAAFEVRVKGDPAAFARRLEQLGCAAEAEVDSLRVELPARGDAGPGLAGGHRRGRAGPHAQAGEKHARGSLPQGRRGARLMPIFDQGYHTGRGRSPDTPGAGWRSPARG